MQKKQLDNIYAPACTGMSSTRSKLIKATPIAVVAIAVYAFFKKVVYKDIVYYGNWELLKSVLGTAIIRFYIKIKECFFYKKKLKPKKLEDVSKEWLMQVLYSAKVLKQSTKISKIAVQKIDAGQTGQAGRLTLEYTNSADAQAAQLPNSMIIKMSRQDFLGSLLNTITRLYEECKTYKTILCEYKLPTCTAYYTDVDPLTKDFILLLEDASFVHGFGYVKSSTISGILRDGRSQEEFADHYKKHYHDKLLPTDKPSLLYNPKTVDLALQYMKSAAKSIAKFHAKSWNSAKLLNELKSNKTVRFKNFARGISLLAADWEKTKAKARSGKYEKTKPWRNAENIAEFEKEIETAVLCPLYNMTRNSGCAGYRKKWRSFLNEDVYTELATSMGCFARIHGDFHVENLFVRQFDNNVSSKDKEILNTALVILDWQVCGIGVPARDIGQLVSLSGLDQYHKRKFEKEIVETWWNELILNGVSDTEYPLSLAWAHYKYHHAATSATILMLANTLKLFEDAGGTIYCMLVDSFREGIERHGSAEKSFNEMQHVLDCMRGEAK